MKNILPIQADEKFFSCVHTIMDKVGMKRVMLTGGEPTIHPDFDKIVDGLQCDEISVTTNGIKTISVEDWLRFKDLGLTKVIVSIHDASPQALVELEIRGRSLGWAKRSLQSQRQNIENACLAGLEVRANIVAYHSSERVLDVINFLSDLQRQYNFEIRILNDLTATDKSQRYIDQVCDQLHAERVLTRRRAGSSNVTTSYKTPSHLRFSTKIAYPYFLGSICDGCTLKPCSEGFYGLRIEKRDHEYYVRLCIYKQTRDVLMPWSEFAESDLLTEMKSLISSDLTYPT